MTEEQFETALKIKEKIEENEKEIPALKERVLRFNDYIKHVSSDESPVVYYGKKYKKVDIAFNMGNPTISDVRDYFDIVEENKKDFLDFLKKCQKNYKKRIEEHESEISGLKSQLEAV